MGLVHDETATTATSTPVHRIDVDMSPPVANSAGSTIADQTLRHPRFGGSGKNELVRDTYSAYPGRCFIPDSSMGTPETRVSKKVMSPALRTVGQAPAATPKQASPHQVTASPK
jgi:hypothetical protein